MAHQKQQQCTEGILTKYVQITPDELINRALPVCKSCNNVLKMYNSQIVAVHAHQDHQSKMQAYCSTCDGYWCTKCSGVAVSNHSKTSVDDERGAVLRAISIQQKHPAEKFLDSADAPVYGSIGYGREKPRAIPAFHELLRKASRKKYTGRTWEDIIGSDGDSPEEENTQPLHSESSGKENVDNKAGENPNTGKYPEKTPKPMPSYYSTRRDPDGSAYLRYYVAKVETI
ncbi:hypothetical protein BZA77DRAFT_358742 [Pyronema omphalodes]|nr:hypothetical protein BZA77DRAFT_358742 [Pyronema omphalodes]